MPKLQAKNCAAKWKSKVNTEIIYSQKEKKNIEKVLFLVLRVVSSTKSGNNFCSEKKKKKSFRGWSFHPEHKISQRERQRRKFLFHGRWEKVSKSSNLALINRVARQREKCGAILVQPCDWIKSDLRAAFRHQSRKSKSCCCFASSRPRQSENNFSQSRFAKLCLRCSLPSEPRKILKVKFRRIRRNDFPFNDGVAPQSSSNFLQRHRSVQSCERANAFTSLFERFFTGHQLVSRETLEAHKTQQPFRCRCLCFSAKL